MLRRLVIHELRTSFELALLIDAHTELDLSAFFAVRLRLRGAEVKLELQGSRGGPELERLLLAVVLPGSRVVISTGSPRAVDEVRRALEPLAASIMLG